MAFSKQPVNSTYSTKTVKLLKEMSSRSSSTAKDSYYLNAYAEIQDNKEIQDKEYICVKRAGVTQGVASTDSGGVRGAYLWKDQNKLFLAILSKIYVYNSLTGALITTLNAVFSTTTGVVGFEEFLYVDTTTKLVATDGTTMVTIDTTNTVVTGTDVDMPVHLPYPVFLDGYLFVIKANSSSVWNSDADDPLLWTSGDFIDAEMRPDQAVRLTLLNNYIAVFGTKTIEYFYDNANASGSPLARNDSPIKAVGFVGGLAKHGNQAYFVGETNETLPDVFMIEDFKIVNLGTEAIRRHLEGYETSISAAIVSFNGHDFYVLTTAAATYALDLETKLWGPWTYAGQATFPVSFSLVENSSSTGYRNWFTTSLDQSLNYFNTAVGSDKGVAFDVEIVTDNEWFDSYNRKVCNRLSVVSDKPTASLLLSIQTSDDDYQTWTTARTIDLYQELPCEYRWGQFRRRAHKLSYTGTLPLRLFRLELDVNLGNT